MDTGFDEDDSCVITGMFDDLDNLDNLDNLDDLEKHNLKSYPEIIIESVDIQDVLSRNKERYNTNNIWTHNIKPKDYKSVSDECNTDKWVDKFHQSYTVINIPVDPWMEKAHNYGVMLGHISKVFEDDIDLYIKSYETPKLRSLLSSKKHFIRSERVSLKRGIHGVGPYTDLKQIIESLITTDAGHSVLTNEEFEKGMLKLYLFDWIDVDEDKEFRVFVKDRKITSISQQFLYSENITLKNKSVEETEKIIRSWFEVIYDYFENTVFKKITHIDSFCVDIMILGNNNEPYFIEINPFGKEYQSGSALFGWAQDEDMLYGKNKTDKIYFRYTVKKDV